MAVIQYLGPPEHEVCLIGYGSVSPGAVITVSDELAAQLVNSGRAEFVTAEEVAEDVPKFSRVSKDEPALSDDTTVPATKDKS